ncbi:DNA-binding response regulator [Actinomadura sp. 1N219]|uniref:DNA-binding response regulator n=1 Tax=Actinomadura sp. 1N219 TaxID=3375152 RepID=UPI00379A3168
MIRALLAALRHRPDVVVIDIGLPGKDGLAAAVEVRERLPECRMLILTGLARPGNLRKAMAAKVSGFILKDAPPEELSEAIRKVARGLRVIDPQLAIAALEADAAPLTERELEVLRLAAGGLDPAEIAERLFLSRGTVRNILTAVVAKLGARNHRPGRPQRAPDRWGAAGGGPSTHRFRRVRPAHRRQRRLERALTTAGGGVARAVSRG